jgi:hypothetical protein
MLFRCPLRGRYQQRLYTLQYIEILILHILLQPVLLLVISDHPYTISLYIYSFPIFLLSSWLYSLFTRFGSYSSDSMGTVCAVEVVDDFKAHVGMWYELTG